MSVTWLILTGYVGLAMAMLVLYVLARWKRNAGIVDVGWAFGVAAFGAWYALWGSAPWPRRALLAVLSGLWGLRLAGYLLRERFLGEAEEDGRYQMLRQAWGRRANVYFFWFFQLQAAWAVLFALPFLPVAFGRAAFPQWYDFAAIGVWLIAVGGETLADRQLASFRRQETSQGRTCRAGLWKYSRHPNYFFEWVHWFAYLLLAFGSDWWPLGLVGPVVMIVFLYKITGIPYTERRALASRGDDYRRYQEQTSAFIPWPPKESP